MQTPRGGGTDARYHDAPAKWTNEQRRDARWDDAPWGASPRREGTRDNEGDAVAKWDAWQDRSERRSEHRSADAGHWKGAQDPHKNP